MSATKLGASAPANDYTLRNNEDGSFDILRGTTVVQKFDTNNVAYTPFGMVVAANTQYSDASMGRPPLQWNPVYGAYAGAVSIADASTKVSHLALQNSLNVVGGVGSIGTEGRKIYIAGIDGTNVKGTILADNAAAGDVGEYMSATGSLTTVNTGTNTNLITLSLSAGDWDVTGRVSWSTTGAITQLSSLQIGISATSANPGAYQTVHQTQSTAAWNSASSGGYGQVTLPTRVSLAATTTVYLVGFSYYTAGGSLLQATGFIQARRVR
jgi:hypothetical protein